MPFSEVGSTRVPSGATHSSVARVGFRAMSAAAVDGAAPRGPSPAPPLGRGHLGGAGRYIEMPLMDKVRMMEEAARSAATDRAETLGGAFELDAADRAHARLKRMAAFDTHDYDPADNDLEEEALRARGREDYVSQVRWTWAMSVVIGVVMGFVAFVVNGLIAKLDAFKFGLTEALIDPGAVQDGGLVPAYLTYVSMSSLYAFVAGAGVAYLGPLAAGSGIPEMKTYLNGVHLKGLLRLRTGVAKLGGIAFSIGAGFIAGKEGPFVHGGGLVGGGLSAFGSHSLGFKTTSPRYFRSDAGKRDFVAIGVATGVAVAFGAPIGGMLFTVEEGSSFHSSHIMWRGFLATCTGVLTKHLLEQLNFDATDLGRARFGTHRDFGLYTDDEANYSRVFWWYFWEVPLFALLGALGGLLGVAFVKVNVKVTQFRQKYIPVRNRTRRLLEVVFVAFVTASIMFIILATSPCEKLPAPLRTDLAPNMGGYPGDPKTPFEYGVSAAKAVAKKHFRRLHCAEGEYATYAQLFFAPLDASLKLLVHLGELGEGDEGNQFYFPMGALVLYFVLMTSLMTWTYGIGAPTGMFVPSLAIGASLGQIFGRAVAAAAHTVDPDLHVDLHTYAVLGTAAALGGTMRLTISVTVLVMETTGSLQLVIPLMLVVFFAKIVGDRFTLGIYDTHIQIRGAPYMYEPTSEKPGPALGVVPALDKLRVSEVMADELVTLKPVSAVEDILDALLNTTHGAFPVAETEARKPGEPIELHGTITRGTLLKLLEHRIGFLEEGESAVEPKRYSAAARDDALEKLKQIPFKAPKVEHLVPGLRGSGDAAKRADLRPFMQRHPFVVHADARLSRAYRLFRAMGLRHMYITPSRPQIVGVVTRKDLAEECAALTLGERGAEESAMDEGSVGSQGRGDHKGDGVGAAYGLPFLPYYPDNVSRESHRYAGDENPSLRNATGLRNRNPSASAAGGRDSPRPEF